MLNFKAKSTLDDNYNSNPNRNPNPIKSIIASDKYTLLNKKVLHKPDSTKDAFCVSRKLDSNHKSKFAAKKKSPTDNCCFSMTRRRCRSVSPSPPLTDVSAISNNFATPTAKIQTLRLESSTKCKKLLTCNGSPNKVILFPEESWARSAASSYWTLSSTWWNCNRCKVVEITGTKRYTAQAKMVETDCGNLYIVGSFKKCADPDFKLILTANITIADFNMGYCMTGSLERGSHKLNTYQTTHFAVIRRAEFNK